VYSRHSDNPLRLWTIASSRPFDFTNAYSVPDGNAEAMTAAAYGASLVGSYVCVRDEGDYGRSVSAYPFVDSAVGARYGL
jgi:hypothetical protein